MRCALILTLLALAMPAAASAAPAHAPAQGIFEGCSLDSALPTCVQRLDVMRAGGFKVVVISASQTSRAALYSYASEAAVRGMSVMWELSDTGWWRTPTAGADPATDFAPFQVACGCRGAKLATYVARWLGRLPGTYGYYAADDSMIASGDRKGVQRFVAALKRGDRRHTTLIGTANTLQQHRYLHSADLVATEVYPVTTGALDPMEARATVTAAQSNANDAHRPTAFILQAFSWGDNLSDGQAIGMCSATDTVAGCGARLTYPSSRQQLMLLDAALHHARPKLILWWSFPNTYGSATAPGSDQLPPTPLQGAQRWSGLVAAIGLR